VVFLDVVFVAVVVGHCLGGRLSNLGRLELHGVRLLYGAVALQLVAFPSGLLPWETNDLLARLIWLASYCLLAAAAYLNRSIRGVTGITAGMTLNLTAILANGGHMPTTLAALAAAHKTYHVHNNSVSLAQPHLAALVDKWAAPGWLPLANVYSVGDITIAVGLFVAIVSAMGPRLRLARPAPAAS
jgi:hypothetical protein